MMLFELHYICNCMVSVCAETSSVVLLCEVYNYVQASVSAFTYLLPLRVNSHVETKCQRLR
jgi:hypothetical protein